MMLLSLSTLSVSATLFAASVLATPPAAPVEPAAPAAASKAETEPETSTTAPVQVTARLQPQPASIGDVLTYEVIATYPTGYSVNIPTTVAVAPHHLIEVEESEPEATSGQLRKVFTLQLQSFALGEQRVPSFPLTYVSPAGAVETITVPAHAFEIASLLANEPDPQPRGDDPPVSLIVEARWAETAAYAALATALLLALALWAWMRWRKRERVAPAPPPLPPEVVAEEALRELEGGELLAEERFGEFYLQLTEILKAYLEGRFGFEALDRTTDEIRRALVRQPDRLAPLASDEVVAFLQRCDLVKFARMQPQREEATEAVGSVRTLVAKSTKPAAAPAGDAPATTNEEASP